MATFTMSDLEKLSRGEFPGPEIFRAILTDPEAVRELDRLRMVHELFEPTNEIEEEAKAGEEVIPMDVTFQELAQYVERQQMDAARRQAVELFLQQHFPEALLP